MDNTEIKTVLIDGYLDEPSCLGVPPYISPHIRYVYGALLDAGIKKENLQYYTIDLIRKNTEQYLEMMEKQNLVLIICGTTVPGNYRGGQPITLKEIKEIGARLHYPRKFLGGPITLVKEQITGYDHLCAEIGAQDIYQILTNKKIKKHDLPKYITRWAEKGASLTHIHPNYPRVVCELETYRGCLRQGHCLFCSEQLKNITYQRQPEEIIREVKALAKAGNHYYRLGCQTDLLLFGARRKQNKLQLQPQKIEKLYSGIRQADPDLKVLHLDNINPANIIKHRPRARQILKTIVKFNTPGDTAAFGLESADPVVLEKNNIATDPQKTFAAIKLMNKIGGKRKKGLPLLLPGLNFLHGLTGETEKTLELNFQFLKKILDSGLLLRRINIRQVVNPGNYPVVDIDKYSFRHYKKKINEEINLPMLKNVFPTGTILENVLTEEQRGETTFGRQLGTYPILVGIPGKLPLNEFFSVRVIDHGYRSITALPWPFKYKEASIEQLTAFPGIGKNKAGEIFIQQPRNKKELKKILEPDFPFEKWKNWFCD
ncbi:MAG: radical SAM protein [Bacillota bacterium]